MLFDEDLSYALKAKIRNLQPQLRNLKHDVLGTKAICILSHFSFNHAFKEILKQLYRIQISNTGLHLPLERFIVNFMDEVPLPDEGKVLVQHELCGETMSFFRPVD